MEATKKKGGKKALVIAGIGVGAVVIAIPVALIALVLVLALSIHLLTPLVFPGFFGKAREEYVTPGIYEGLVPQGYAYDEDERVYLQCGYMADGESASRIYVTIPTSDTTYETVGYVELYEKDGEPYTGHTGGITSYKDFVWLANDGEGEGNCVWVLSLDEILDTAKSNGKITLKTSFQSETRAACCFADGEYLFVGEFNNSEEYCAKDTHAFKVADGEVNKALVCAYKLDLSTDIGVEYTYLDGEEVIIPTFALSVRDLVQGFTRTPDGFAISTSYGVSFSNVYIYEGINKYREPDDILDVNGYAVPVYFLDNDSLKDKITMPPMSEEIFVKDGRLYILFESACQKYIFGNLTRGVHIYSYDLTK